MEAHCDRIDVNENEEQRRFAGNILAKEKKRKRKKKRDPGASTRFSSVAFYQRNARRLSPPE